MRDTIKSEEYFDEYILKMLEGIKRFEEGLAEGRYLEDKKLFVKDYIDGRIKKVQNKMRKLRRNMV